MSVCIFSLSITFPNQFTAIETAPGAQWMRGFQQQAPYLPEYKTTPLRIFNFQENTVGYVTTNKCYN
jgi:hypothetical protein